MSAFYNEFEAYPAQWLRNLINAGHIAPGVVDDRSIKDVTPDDLNTHTQAHFFAGVGVWSHALRLAGWPDDRPVWTGSCPCQPFSVAGRGLGIDDPRHLWPVWFELIKQRRPPVVFGEQVASPDGLTWLDAVRADLEGAGYAFGAADLCAAGVGAPHIRQRLYFVGIRLADDGREGRRQVGPDTRGRDEGGRTTRVDKRSLHGGAFSTRGLADSADVRLNGRRSSQASDGRDTARVESERLRDARGLANDDEGGQQQQRAPRVHEEGPPWNDTHGRSQAGGLGHADGEHARGHAGAGDRKEGGARLRSSGDEPRPSSAARGVAIAASARLEGRAASREHADAQRSTSERGSPTSGFWAGPDWVPCRDGKLRPVEPGSFPLAHGAPARVGRLRAYGNAIVSEVAATFIRAVMETL